VLFFECSLSGLEVGSPVTFRGIKIGQVTDIVIHYDVDKQKLLIPVFIEVEPERIEVVSGERSTKNLKALIDRGLRAQLQVQSLVTGQVGVDLDFHPETPVKLVGAVPNLPEVPTVPSSMDVLRASVTSLINKINQLPLEQISKEILTTVHDADEVVKETRQAVTDARTLLQSVNTQVGPISNSVIATSDQANKTLVDAQKLISDADGDLPKLVAAAQAVLSKAGAALDQADAALRGAQRILKPDSPAYVELTQTLQDLRATSTAIRAFAEYLQRNPNALLTGKR
jgi:paraquat-inducible protein B